MDQCSDCGQRLEKLPHGGTAYCCHGAYATIERPQPKDVLIARDLGIRYFSFKTIGLSFFIYARHDWPGWAKLRV